MRPILLKGHERPITFVKYNREGDLLFTCSKDSVATVWWSDNGERIGTYRGHTGAVWSLDVTDDSRHIITGAADNSVKIWDVALGSELCTIPHPGPVRSVAYALGDRRALTVTDSFMEHQAAFHVYDVAENASRQSKSPLRTFRGHEGRINEALWGPLNDLIFSAGEDGTVRTFDAETGQQVGLIREHKKAVNSIAFSKDQTLFITSSSDHTAKLFDTKTLQLLKTYQTERPVNAAAISPLFDASRPRYHVAVGGGQEARDVTTTSTRVGKFDVNFFHMIYEEEIGTVKGHFGPVNTLAFHPDGRSFASGAEDGYVRLHFFDRDYFEQARFD